MIIIFYITINTIIVAIIAAIVFPHTLLMLRCYRWLAVTLASND